MTQQSGDVRALVEQIAKAIVDEPDQVSVSQVEGDVLELKVGSDDVGKVIGAKAAWRAPCERWSAQPEFGCKSVSRWRYWNRIGITASSLPGARAKTQGRRGEVAVELHSDVP